MSWLKFFKIVLKFCLSLIKKTLPLKILTKLNICLKFFSKHATQSKTLKLLENQVLKIFIIILKFYFFVKKKLKRVFKRFEVFNHTANSKLSLK